MSQTERIYIAIDLKSFYASVECVERGLNPMKTNLVVADKSRTEKTICLAVSPSLKTYGIPGRARLFEVVQKVKEVNADRRNRAIGQEFTGTSFDDEELKADAALELDYVVAPPRMALYMEYSTRIYNIYLNYVAPEDIHVYSIDEVFMDVTGYLHIYKMNARELAAKMMQDVFEQTGIPATAGIGSNLYLCKVAMDIVAKHIPLDRNGMRIAELSEMSYRKLLWSHTPITDFWRVGRGYAKKLEEHNIFTMGDVARCSVGGANDYYNEDLLYRLFGINAELLIDHAWGYEPCTMADIKAYKPAANSIGSGQVLQCPYTFEKARLVVQEMAELLALDLVDKGLVTAQMVLTVGYDRENLNHPEISKKYKGAVATDHYGRMVPKHAHGSINLPCATSSTRLVTEAVVGLFDQIVNRELLVRRIQVTANRVVEEKDGNTEPVYEQLDLFTDYTAQKERQEKEKMELEREKKMNRAILDIKKKYGKNAILKGMNLEDGSTAIQRNNQIGGHRA